MSIVCAIAVPHPPIIIPEIGGGQEQEINKTIEAYKKASSFLVQEQPETIIIISPHNTMYSNYFHISSGISAKGSFAQFNVDTVKFEVQYDTQFITELSNYAEKIGFAAGIYGEKDKRLDHGTMVPLYFIKQAYRNEIQSKIIRVGLSGLPYTDHYKFGMLIREISEKLNRKTAVVASGDLSHKLKSDGPYGYNAEGSVYDGKIMDVLSRGAFGELFYFDESFCENAGECGHRAYIIMAGCFNGEKVKAENLSYEGPFGVGYGVCIFNSNGSDTGCYYLDKYRTEQKEQLETTRQNEDEYVKLARKSVEAYVLFGERIGIPDNLTLEMIKKRSGVFVSLKKQGQLRGCIGTISPATENIAREIIDNAISSAAHDTRFNPVTIDELSELVYNVDVLGEVENIKSETDLDVRRYGVIVISGNKRGLLLPNLDGIDSVEQQITIARKKAGIRDFEKISMQRFEVVRHH